MVHADGRQGCDCHELVERDKFWDGHVDVQYSASHGVYAKVSLFASQRLTARCDHCAALTVN